MNLKYLFELQGGLMANIKKQHKLEEISFDKTVLALLVEVGECANEQRSWKYWSKDLKPRTEVLDRCNCPHCPCLEEEMETKNLLLEEYVDGLHFVIQLGILIGYEELDLIGIAPKEDNIELMFKEIYRRTILLDAYRDKLRYSLLFDTYLTLGMMLGFTESEVEHAYIQKNRTNHHRQLTGY
jgi:dimeric dUTPase (all-alpha-NTP-PPase superfamily)